MKRVLIIGAGFLQSFVIKKAKAMGYYTLAVDADPDAVGFAYADEYGIVDIVDEEACLEFAKEHQIDGVLTAATEYGVLTAAYIAKEMKLPGLDYESAKKVKNKYLVRKCFIENHIDDSDDQAYLVDSHANIITLAGKLHYPVMVKPCDGSGSRAARRVDNPGDLQDACISAMKNAMTRCAIIETFSPGQEYGAESLVLNGEIHVLAIMKKWMTKHPFYAELGHAIPCGLPASIEAKATKCVKEAIKALGINFGAVNTDMLITADGEIHIVDIGSRMGGNMIGPCIIPYGTGIDYMGAVIRAAVSDNVDFTVCPHGAVATKLLAFHDGVVKRLPDIEKLQREYDVEIYHHMKLEDTVHAYQTNHDGQGYIVAKAATVEKAEQTAKEVLDYISDYVFG